MNRIDKKKFKELCKIVPELLEIEKRIKSITHDENFCANHVWYQSPGFKKWVCSLVGWSARNEAVSDGDSYDTAYDYLYDLLPACNHENDCY